MTDHQEIAARLDRDLKLGLPLALAVRRGADGRWRYIIDNNQGTAVRRPA